MLREGAAGTSIIRWVKSRFAFSGAGLVGISVILIALAAPFRPQWTPLPSDWEAAPGITISVYPSETAFAGDWISVAASADFDPGGRKLRVRLDRSDGEPVGESPFFKNGNSTNWDARLAWVWNSSGGDGWHTLYITLSGDAAPASEPIRYPVRVLPAEKKPAERRDAAWRQAEGVCCDVFYLSGTEAQRDLMELQPLTEEIFKSRLNRRWEGHPQGKGGVHPRSARAGKAARTKLGLVFLPRVYGQGGLATLEGYISYTDRNYTGTDFPVVLEHEMVHLMTIARYGSGLRAPLFLQEGWAVFLTGGHYRAPEPLEDTGGRADDAWKIHAACGSGELLYQPRSTKRRTSKPGRSWSISPGVSGASG